MIAATHHALLQLEQLSIGYKHKTLLANCSTSLSKGRLVALVGANGTGKSTLLRAIAFGDCVLSGSYSVGGQSATQLSATDRAGWIAMAIPPESVDDYMRVCDFVAIGRYPYLGNRGIPKPHDRKVVAHALQMCSLVGYEHRYYSSLSDGEKQRVLIARALAQETPIILLDEPTAHLDLVYRVRFFSLLAELAHQSERTILLSTHELSLAMEFADLLWLLDGKGQLHCGLPEELALHGHLDAAFHAEGTLFDARSAQLRMAPGTLLRPIQLLGEEEEMLYWTQRMLRRLGYDPTQEPCAMSLSCRREGEKSLWKLSSNGTDKAFTSLEQLEKELAPCAVCR